MLALGVDVSVARGLDLVFLDGERRLAGAALRKQSAADLTRLLRERRPDVVAIDSPPGFGTSGLRSCERELFGLGISLYWTPFRREQMQNKFYGWMSAGHEAFAAAREAGYQMFAGGAHVRMSAIEVFPHGSAVALKRILPAPGISKSRAQKRLWRAEALRVVGVDTAELRSPDEIDAALAALTGIFALEGKFWTAGAPGEPLIVLPGEKPAGRFARESAAAEMTARPVGAATLELIGHIRSTLRDPHGAPRQGAEGGPDAWLEIEPRFARALHGIARGDELIVITWLHRANRRVHEVHPRDDPSNPLTGVFGTRSQDRPNPLGLHRVTVREVDGSRLRIGPIEAIDGTPVVDVKTVLGDRADG